MRRKHDPKFKAKVALEAIKEERTLGEISSQYQVHRVQISNWKKVAQEAIPLAFKSSKERSGVKEQEALIDELYKQVGRLKMENEWIKKKSESFS